MMDVLKMSNKNQLQEYCIPYWQVNMVESTAEFWRDMAIWTRIYIASAYTGLEDQEEVFSRLYRVPYEFGGTIRLLFGDQIANAYINNLAYQVVLIRNLVNAQISGDTDTVNKNTALLYQNADARAVFLTQVNPYWHVNDWRGLMYTFISLLLEESTSYLAKDYSKSIDIFDRLLGQATQIANYFSEGVFNYLFYNRMAPR